MVSGEGGRVLSGEGVREGRREGGREVSDEGEGRTDGGAVTGRLGRVVFCFQVVVELLVVHGG